MSRRINVQNLYKSAQTIIWANVVQGNALSHKNSLDEEIVISQWEQIPEAPKKVRRKPLLYSSLSSSNKDSSEQLNLFSYINDIEERAMPSQRYLLVDIDHVWREEKEDV